GATITNRVGKGVFVDRFEVSWHRLESSPKIAVAAPPRNGALGLPHPIHNLLLLHPREAGLPAGTLGS
ncbi:hypothetical protein PMAYCL1PPCAC_29096, partial [Pristionchus mayeri]